MQEADTGTFSDSNTHTAVVAQGAAGQAETTVATEASEATSQTALYPADAEHYEIEVVDENGDEKFILAFAFRPITLKLLQEYDDNTVDESEILGPGREKPRFSDDNANDILFDALILKGTYRPYGAPVDEEKEIPLDKLRGSGVGHLTVEKKSKALRKYLRCSVEVKTSVAESGIAYLFESEGEMEVTLKIGDPRKPFYVVPLKMKRPAKGKRTQFKDGFTGSETRRKKGKVKRVSVTDHATAVRFFDQHFISAKDVLLQGQPYDDGMKAAFLGRFNPAFKEEVSAGVVFSFHGDESD